MTEFIPNLKNSNNLRTGNQIRFELRGLYKNTWQIKGTVEWKCVIYVQYTSSESIKWRC
jgi:hypothetical protein